jgi:hypothetical protein
MRWRSSSRRDNWILASVLEGRRKNYVHFPVSLAGHIFILPGNQPRCGWLVSLIPPGLKSRRSVSGAVSLRCARPLGCILTLYPPVGGSPEPKRGIIQCYEVFREGAKNCARGGRAPQAPLGRRTLLNPDTVSSCAPPPLSPHKRLASGAGQSILSDR